VNSLIGASEIFSKNLSEYLNACRQGSKSRYNFRILCETYKAILDSNFSGTFCIGEHCKTVYMVEIKFDGSNWGATPKIFYSEAEAKAEAEQLRLKYPFLTECRIVTRKIEEKENKY
jgi:hypothetical protein